MIVVSTLCDQIGIPNDYGDDISAKIHRGIEGYRLLRSPELYNEVRKNKMLAGETMLLYEVAVNRHIGIASIAHLTFAVSTRVPSYQSSKTFANCKPAFDGFPVGGSGALVKYICCVASNIKIRDIEPWSSLRNVHADNMVAQVHKFIQNIVMKEFYAPKLIHRKKMYLQNRQSEMTEEPAPEREYGRLLPLQYSERASFVEASDDFFAAIQRQVMSCDPGVWDSVGVLNGKIAALSMNRHADFVGYVKTLPPLFPRSFNVFNSCYADMDRVKTSDRLSAYVGASRVWGAPTMIYQSASLPEPLESDDWKHDEAVVFKYFIRRLNFDNNRPIPSDLSEFAAKKPSASIDKLKPAEQIAILKNESYLFDGKMLDAALKLSGRKKGIAPDPVESDAHRAYEMLQTLRAPPTILTTELLSIYGGLIGPESSLNKLVNDKLAALLFPRMDAAVGTVIGQVQKASRTKTFAGKIRALYDGLKAMDPVKAAANLQLYIRQIIEVYPTMIMNGTPVMPTMRHWDLSVKHYQDIKTIILREVEALISVSKRHGVREVVVRLHAQWSGISAFVRAMKLADGGKTGSRAKVRVMILRYIFIRLLEDICTVAADSGSREQPLYLALIEAFLRPLIDHFAMSSHTYDYVSSYVAKINHSEQMRILQIFDELTHEERMVENMKRDYKLGQWDIDVQKKVINYDKDTYDQKHDEVYSPDDIRYELKNEMFSDARGEDADDAADAEEGGGYDQDDDVYDENDD